MYTCIFYWFWTTKKSMILCSFCREWTILSALKLRNINPRQCYIAKQRVSTETVHLEHFFSNDSVLTIIKGFRNEGEYNEISASRIFYCMIYCIIWHLWVYVAVTQ